MQSTNRLVLESCQRRGSFLHSLGRNLPDILAKTPDAAHVGQDPNPHTSELISKAVQIDTAMRESVPAGWKGDGIKERLVRRTLLPLVDGDREAMLRLFELVKNQPGYS